MEERKGRGREETAMTDSYDRVFSEGVNSVSGEKRN